MPEQTSPAPTSNTQAATSTALSQATTTINFRVYKKSKNSIFITWGTLPSGTIQLNIYRTPVGLNDWKLWKTLDVSGKEGGGSIQLSLGANENPSSYSYYLQGISETNLPTGSSPWTDASTSTPPLPSPAAAPEPTPAPSSTPTPTPSPSSSSGGETSSSNPIGPPSSTSNYYTPNGQPSGSTPTGNLWAQWGDRQDIVIGWNNLPSPIDTLIIYRSSSADGPWAGLYTQSGGNIPLSSSIDLVDSSVNDSYYYKMDVLFQSQVVASYGPIFVAKP